MSAFDNPTTRRKVDTILGSAFQESGYMQRMGTGDVQAVCHAYSAAVDLENPEDFLAGAIMATALCDSYTAQQAAADMLDEDYRESCEYCQSDINVEDGVCAVCNGEDEAPALHAGMAT